MKILTQLLGSKKPTTDTVSAEIARHEADRTREQERAARARDELANVGLLNDAEHVHAEAEAAAAARAIIRIDARLVELRAAHVEAVKADERAALKALVEAARRRVDDAPKLLDRYEALAAELADVAGRLNAIDREVGSANRLIEMARQAEPDAELPDPVVTVTERFRTEPDEVTPDRKVVEEKWEEPDSYTGRYSAVNVFTVRDGVKIPNNPAARKVTRERIIPGEVRRGRVLSSPTQGLVLPAARLGQKPFWPTH